MVSLRPTCPSASCCPLAGSRLSLADGMQQTWHVKGRERGCVVLPWPLCNDHEQMFRLDHRVGKPPATVYHMPLINVVVCYTVTELTWGLPVRVCKADQITFLFLPVMDSADTWKGWGFTGIFLGRPRPASALWCHSAKTERCAGWTACF